MSQHTTTTWTCDGCGVTHDEPGGDSPLGWTRVVLVRTRAVPGLQAEELATHLRIIRTRGLADTEAAFVATLHNAREAWEHYELPVSRDYCPTCEPVLGKPTVQATPEQWDAYRYILAAVDGEGSHLTLT